MVFEVIIQYILCKTDNLILKLNLSVLPYIQFDWTETYNYSKFAFVLSHITTYLLALRQFPNCIFMSFMMF